MTNPFKSRASSLSGPARDVFPITPSDSVDLSDVAVSLYIEVGGTLSVVTAAGNTRTLAVDDMTILPLGTLRVNATGTTASGIHGFMV